MRMTKNQRMMRFFGLGLSISALIYAPILFHLGSFAWAWVQVALGIFGFTLSVLSLAAVRRGWCSLSTRHQIGPAGVGPRGGACWCGWRGGF